MMRTREVQLGEVHGWSHRFLVMRTDAQYTTLKPVHEVKQGSISG